MYINKSDEIFIERSVHLEADAVDMVEHRQLNNSTYPPCNHLRDNSETEGIFL